MSTPVPDYLIEDGGTYWASWGSKGWSAVKILQVKRTRAIVKRVNSKTNETLGSNATVRLDELVKRISKLNGKDKPMKSPSVVFAAIRKARSLD